MARRYRWCPAKCVCGGLPRLDFQLLAETKCQETLGDAFEGAQLSCHCSEWATAMVTMMLWEKTLRV